MPKLCRNWTLNWNISRAEIHGINKMNIPWNPDLAKFRIPDTTWIRPNTAVKSKLIILELFRIFPNMFHINYICHEILFYKRETPADLRPKWKISHCPWYRNIQFEKFTFEITTTIFETFWFTKKKYLQ